MSVTISAATHELHKLFNCLNKHFFAGELPMVALTIQTRGKRLAYGWFTVGKVWTADNVEMHEINIAAETLDRSYEEIVRTLLHEMVHLHCSEKGIKDTSRNGTFHNKKFKEECEKHGMFYDEPADKKYGWAFPRLSWETIKLVNNKFHFQINKEVFVLARSSETGSDGEEKKSNSYKWVCPECQAKVRSTKPEVKIVCGECSDFESLKIVQFQLED